MRKVPANGTLSLDERGVAPCGVVARPLSKWSTHVCVEWEIRTFADLFREVFLMQKKENGVWKRILFSKVLENKSASQRLAYIGVMTAFSVVANMFFEFKLADTQFSLTLFLSALTGILIGPIFGFIACFLGDLVGFLYHSAGFAYMPWIGISMGLVALLSGLIMSFWRGNGKRWFFYVKLTVVCAATFLLCTVAINTTAFWLLHSKVGYGTYLVSRLFVQGQIWNSLLNYALLFIALPILNRVKPLKISIE